MICACFSGIPGSSLLKKSILWVEKNGSLGNAVLGHKAITCSWVLGCAVLHMRQGYSTKSQCGVYECSLQST